MEPIILASGSPRRKEILTRLGFPLEIVVPEIEEKSYTAPTPAELTQLLARKKVEAAAEGLNSCRWVLGSDTVVAAGGKLLGKPGNREEAGEMLKLLSGNTHEVISGIALLPEKGRAITTRAVTTEVKFRKMAPREIDFYLDQGEWQDAAGGYKIQKRGAFFIEKINGSYSNVVGLPISCFYVMLVDNNYQF